MLNNAWEISNVEIIMQARNLKVLGISNSHITQKRNRTAVSVSCDGIKQTSRGIVIYYLR